MMRRRKVLKLEETLGKVVLVVPPEAQKVAAKAVIVVLTVDVLLPGTGAPPEVAPSVLVGEIATAARDHPLVVQLILE